MNLDALFAQNDPVLIATFLLLCGMSLASWTVIFWKAWTLRRERGLLRRFRARYAHTPAWPRRPAPTKGAPGGAGLLLREADGLELVLTACDPSERRDILSMHLAQCLDRIRVTLDQGLTLLASIGSSAPFIGLFGTVWGIYGALGRIAAAGNAGLDVVAGPMGEALVATAVGLFAAIPAVLAYNGFVRRNRLLVQDLRHIAEQLALYLAPAANRTTTEPVRLVKDGR